MSDLTRLCEQLARRIATTPLERGFCTSVVAQETGQFSRAQPAASVFPSTLALTSLQNASHHATTRMQQRLAEALWTQQAENGAFNYWQRGSEDSKRQPYPDDLDTTCCAFAALASATPDRITGDLLAKVTMLLLVAEMDTSGPYRTWLVPNTADAAWKDIDPAVNANIGRFLDGQDVTLPGLTQYLLDTLVAGRAQSPYYLSPIATYYFLSAWWKKETAAAAIADLHARQQKNNSWGTPLETAWAISALLRWEGRSPRVARGIDWLASQPQKQLARPYALCIHTVQQDQKEYLGSSLVTLAACLETFTAWEHLQETAAAIAHHAPTETPRRHTEVMDRIAARIAMLPHPLRPLAQEQFSRFRTSEEGQQIALLPSRFAATLPPRIQTQLPEALLIRLGMVNVYGWMAYTAYDDLLDEEGDLRDLSVANIFLRELTMQFAALARNTKPVRALFCRVMDGIDAANAWEVMFWRLQRIRPGAWRIPYPLPDAEGGRRLAHRSLGHALGPLTLLVLAGRDLNHPQFQALEAFFTQYIIARQMDDDAHDWEEDLSRGQLNSVSADLLNAWIPGQASHTLTKDDFPKLRVFFWEHRVETICQRILEQTDTAEKQLRVLPFVVNPQPLLELLQPIRASARRALTERERTLAFLKTYRAKHIK